MTNSQRLRCRYKAHFTMVFTWILHSREYYIFTWCTVCNSYYCTSMHIGHVGHVWQSILFLKQHFIALHLYVTSVNNVKGTVQCGLHWVSTLMLFNRTGNKGNNYLCEFSVPEWSNRCTLLIGEILQIIYYQWNCILYLGICEIFTSNVSWTFNW